MAKAKVAGGFQLSGKLGNTLVFVPYGDEVIVRSAPEKRKRDSWSPKQQEHRMRFRALSFFYKAYRENVVKPIWNLSATVKYTGYNLFVQANMPAFGRYGALTDPDLLHFSTGPVPLPQELRVERSADDPAVVRISWSTDQLSRQAQTNDCLMGIYYSRDGSQPFEIGATRGQGEALLPLKEWQITRQFHIHLFFRRDDRSAYSPDRCFLV
ncbi:hypothetical protein C8N47_10529 [Mangrovibacterium marinum]|uniref:Uncharacterized protein n=1 Tax=Mangrovibacterium marinum TaxID=1639118 RepID=A0A2T5C390_9BACT|nr:hypothetical protein [Mangrovibacterium marinum]PTN09189.1 hypothetical protein C8N47_10529 [Mangrovibacterium marinum]